MVDKIIEIQSQETMKLKGERPAETDVEWIKIGQDLVKDSPAHLDSVANTLITLDTSLIAIFTGTLTFFNIQNNISSILPSWASVWGFWVIAAFPVLLWLISIRSNLDVIMATSISFKKNSPGDIERAISDLSEIKYKHLNIGKTLFIGGLLASVIILIIGSTFVPTKTVQFVFSEEKSSAFQNMSIMDKDNKLQTVPLTLLGQNDDNYLVKLSYEKTMEINKDLIEGIIYL